MRSMCAFLRRIWLIFPEVVHMKLLFCAVVTVVCRLTVVVAGAEATFTLVKDGKPACSIIIAEKPSYNADYAAKELQSYILKISGAKLEIHSDAEKSGDGGKILVGRSNLTDAMDGLKIPAGLTMNLREEG